MTCISRVAHIDELTNDPEQKEDEDSDCEIDDNSANQMSEVLLNIKSYKEAIYCGPRRCTVFTP